MAIITISRGAYSQGKAVAELLAERLGYTCVSREILLNASEEFNIPEIKLKRAIHDSPSILERFTRGKERYVTYIRAALLKYARTGNVVYHGLAGHFLLQEVPRVLKVRIIADIEDRVAEEVRREGVSTDKARELIDRDDQERRKWSLHLYGADPWDPALYDLVLHVKSTTVEGAVSLIGFIAGLPGFQITPRVQQILDDVALGAQVEGALIEEFPSARASASQGRVLVSAPGYPKTEIEEVARRIRQIAWKAAGVHVEVSHQKFERQAAEKEPPDIPYTANEFIRQAYDGDVRSVNFFLNSGMTPNVKTGEGESPLLAAAENGHVEIVTALLAKGAAVNARSNSGLTPLLLAAQNGHTEVIYALLSKGADVNATDNGGATPLLPAARNGHTEIVDALLDAGADVNTKNKDGLTPLLLVAQNGHTDIIDVLLAEGADPNATSNDGLTPLIFAAQNGHADIVSVLLESGAAPNATTGAGMTALALAEAEGYKQIVQLLKQAGAGD